MWRESRTNSSGSAKVVRTGGWIGFCVSCIVIVLVTAGCGSSGTVAVADLSGRWALWATYADGDSDRDVLTLLQVEQTGATLILRDEASGEEVASGSVLAGGQVRLRWTGESDEWRGRIEHTASVTSSALPDDWGILGIVAQPGPSGLKDWWVHREEEAWAAASAEGQTASSLNGFERIEAAGDLVDSLQEPGTQEGDEVIEPQQAVTGQLQCVTRPITERIVQSFDGGTLLDYDPTVLYPGNLLQGKDLLDGYLNALTRIPRAGGTLVISNLTFAGAPRLGQAIDVVDQYNVQQAIHDLISQEVEGTAAHIDARVEQVYSAEQASLAIGASLKFWKVSVKSNLSVDRESKQNSHLFWYTQKFYTISLQTPGDPVDVFRDGDDFVDGRNDIRPGNPPLYISSVDYGRQLFLLVETNESQKAFRLALNAAFNGFGVNTKVDGERTAKEVMQNAKVKYWARGGNAALAASVLAGGPEEIFAGVTGLFKNENFATFSKQNPGVPISYTIKYLYDNKPVATGLQANYDKRDCYVVPAVPKWTFEVYNETENSTLTVTRDGRTLPDSAIDYIGSGNTGTGTSAKNSGGTWDLSVPSGDTNDHLFSFALKPKEDAFAAGSFYVKKNGFVKWQAQYSKRYAVDQNYLWATFRYSNRPGDDLELTQCGRFDNTKDRAHNCTGDYPIKK